MWQRKALARVYIVQSQLQTHKLCNDTLSDYRSLNQYLAFKKTPYGSVFHVAAARIRLREALLFRMSALDFVHSARRYFAGAVTREIGPFSACSRQT